MPKRLGHVPKACFTHARTAYGISSLRTCTITAVHVVLCTVAVTKLVALGSTAGGLAWMGLVADVAAAALQAVVVVVGAALEEGTGM